MKFTRFTDLKACSTMSRFHLAIVSTTPVGAARKAQPISMMLRSAS